MREMTPSKESPASLKMGKQRKPPKNRWEHQPPRTNHCRTARKRARRNPWGRKCDTQTFTKNYLGKYAPGRRIRPRRLALATKNSRCRRRPPTRKRAMNPQVPTHTHRIDPSYKYGRRSKSGTDPVWRALLALCAGAAAAEEPREKPTGTIQVGMKSLDKQHDSCTALE